MNAALRFPVNPEFDNAPIVLSGDDWDGLLASICRLVEENEVLRQKLQRYRDCHRSLITKRQLAKQLRLEVPA